MTNFDVLKKMEYIIPCVLCIHNKHVDNFIHIRERPGEIIYAKPQIDQYVDFYENQISDLKNRIQELSRKIDYKDTVIDYLTRINAERIINEWEKLSK